jgi:hypothetical protein
VATAEKQLKDLIGNFGLAHDFVKMLGLFGFGSFLQPSAKPLNVEKSQLVAVVSNNNKAESNSNIAKTSNQETVSNSTPKSAPTVQSQVIENAKQPPTLRPKETPQNVAEEPVYFCGAQTKKGNPCTRKVKGGGRCWQHAGQPAVLAKEKLVASQ